MKAEFYRDFSGCRAFETGEVYLQMAYNAYYTNLELALANTYFGAKAIYPEAFADIDMKAKTNEKMGFVGAGEGVAVTAAVTICNNGKGE